MNNTIPVCVKHNSYSRFGAGLRALRCPAGPSGHPATNFVWRQAKSATVRPLLLVQSGEQGLSSVLARSVDQTHGALAVVDLDAEAVHAGVSR